MSCGQHKSEPQQNVLGGQHSFDCGDTSEQQTEFAPKQKRSLPQHVALPSQALPVSCSKQHLMGPGIQHGFWPILMKLHKADLLKVSRLDWELCVIEAIAG